MSTQSDPLETTAQELHRFWFAIATEEQWYAVMRECRVWFGRNWRGMSKVRRRLDTGRKARPTTIQVWFDIPDPRFATWASVKFSLQVQSDAKRASGK